jgi:hypothetical protein
VSRFKSWVWRLFPVSYGAILAVFVVTFWAPVERTSWFLLVFVGVCLAWFLSHKAIDLSFRKRFATAKVLGSVESRYAVAAYFGGITLAASALLLGLSIGGAVYFAERWGPNPGTLVTLYFCILFGSVFYIRLRSWTETGDWATLAKLRRRFTAAPSGGIGVALD